MIYEPTETDLEEMEEIQAIREMNRICGMILAKQRNLQNHVHFEALRDRMTEVIQKRWNSQ